MGKERETVTQTQTQQAQPTAEETALNQLALERATAAQPGTIQAQTSGLSLINQLLTGQALPGFLEKLPGGISPEVTQGIVQESLEDLEARANVQGLLDSGTRAELSTRTAGDIRRASEEFNLGQLLNLLNLAVGGQAQIQAPILSQAATLGQRLAGLRATTATGTGDTTTRTNFFASPFGAGIGQGFGAATGTALFGG